MFAVRTRTRKNVVVACFCSLFELESENSKRNNVTANNILMARQRFKVMETTIC